MEPRARASRHKTSLNFGSDLEGMLLAFGAPSPSYPTSSTTDHQAYPETIRVLDEIVTDFIIETCFSAVAIASYSGRAKLKLADFEWAIRKDKVKMGHVHTMMQRKRDIDSKRKVFNVAEVGEGQGKIAVDDMALLGGAVGEEGTGRGKGRGRGKRRKRKREDVLGPQVDGAGDDGLAGGEEEGDGDEDEGERASKRARSLGVDSE